MKNTEIVIIGAGMAGIASAVYLKRTNADFVLIDGNEIGGQLNKISDIENYPTILKNSGLEIIEKLKEQLKYNEVEVQKENVQTILKSTEGFEVVTDKEIYKSKAVIVASGSKHNPMSIPGEEKYLGQGVSYCAVCDGNFFKNQEVAVIGNNNVAIEEAIYLLNLVKKLYFICPESNLLGSDENISKIQNYENVEFLYNSKVDEIKGDDFGVTSIQVGNKEIPVFGVFPYLGVKTTTQILSNLKPNMVNSFVITDENMMSNIEGLFAAGDVRLKKVKQLITAAGDGAIAATNAFNNIKKD